MELTFKDESLCCPPEDAYVRMFLRGRPVTMHIPDQQRGSYSLDHKVALPNHKLKLQWVYPPHHQDALIALILTSVRFSAALSRSFLLCSLLPSSLLNGAAGTATEDGTAGPTCTCCPQVRSSTSTPPWWCCTTPRSSSRGTTWVTTMTSSGEDTLAG